MQAKKSIKLHLNNIVYIKHKLPCATLFASGILVLRIRNSCNRRNSVMNISLLERGKKCALKQNIKTGGVSY